MENTGSVVGQSASYLETAKKDTFSSELRKWSDSVLNKKVLTPGDARDELLKIEKDLNLNDDDSRMLGLFSELMGVMATQERNAGEVKKIESVKVQQAFIREVLSRTINGNFVDDKFPSFFLTASSIYEKMRVEGIFSEKGLSSNGGRLAGIRGMVSTALLFGKAGFDVEIPDVSWDAYHDVDLLVSKNGKKYSVSIKSLAGHTDEETEEAFSVKQDKRPSGLPEKYYESVSKHIWINIPNQADEEDARAFCTAGAKNVATGVPGDTALKFFGSVSKRLRID